jgi:CubicO group peptidase (beta-lactamase class C family)
MTPDRLTDEQRSELHAALRPIRGVTVDPGSLAEHVVAPEALRQVTVDKGLAEGRTTFARPYLSVPHRLNTRGFKTGLRKALKDKVAGYSMELRRHGMAVQTDNWGWAKRPNDGGQAWTTGVRMHVASVSKLITAVAMTKVLAAHGISPDARIRDQLPGYWLRGPHIGDITYRHLMTHTSGFNVTSPSDSASDFATMKAQVAAGVSGVGSYRYENMNFGLCRILLATITGAIPVDLDWSLSFIPEDFVWDVITTSAYSDFVETHVFGAACVTGPTLDHPSQDALAYGMPLGSGWNSGNLTSMAGGAGWHASVRDLLAVMNDVRRGGNILEPGQAQGMLDDGFGIDLTLTTPAGTLYNKNGFWRDNSGRTEQALAYFLPEDMELVVLANSPVGSQNAFFRDVVTDVYLDNLESVFDLPLDVQLGPHMRT